MRMSLFTDVVPEELRSTAAAARCAACRHRTYDRASLERGIAGLTVFGSGFGASVADSRLCIVHDRLVSPGDTCARFEPLLAG